MDFSTEMFLPDIVRREGRSLLQYVGDSLPWEVPEDPSAMARLEKMIEEARRGLAGLAQLLGKHRVASPHLGAYPMAFTNLNNVSLCHLLPLLIDDQRRAIFDLERNKFRLTDAEAKSLVRQYLDMKRRHLQTLESLAASPPPLPPPP